MGSSQSHPSSPSNRSQREASPASPRNRSNGLRRFSSLSHSRSSRDGSRRGRRRSPDSKLVDKRPRLAEGIIQDDAASTSASPQAIKPPEVISSADSDPAITQFPAESVISLPPVISPHPPLPGDPLFRDGDRLSSTADDTSSQNGHHSTPSASTSIVRRFRGRSLPLAPAATEESSLSNRLTALLGFSAPAVSRPAPAAHIGEPELGENVNIEELQTRLNRAREDLAETQRMLNETQARIEAANRRQIPQGAVLVIQGLAQTHTLEEDTEAIQRDSPDRELPRPSLRRLRRSSDSNTQRPRAARNDVNGTSLEAQARMIGGLLSVAAAATATALLSHTNPQPASTRSTATSAVENILSRVRSNRLRSSQYSVGPALGNYLRTVLRENRRLDSSQTVLAQVSAEATDTEISNEFQTFLETLQGDLVGAVREYAAPSPTVEADRLLEVAQSVREGEEPIPRFHHQLGQTLPGTRSSSGVTGDDNGEPRRLTFFRAYRFPQVPNGGENVVPCIFITVRSIRHDPNLTSEELLQHPSFPFVDGHVPSSSSDVDETTGNPTSNSTAEPSSTTPITTRRNLRQRVMNRLSSRRPSSPSGPFNTYLVSVIGGNYPPSHPVLAIPNLITGGTLTDEEMQLIGELLGPVKPPTASMEDIEKAGLSIIDGSEMASRAEKGEVLASCVERCLICLGEYEEGEECRLLKCRHGYHKDCVDEWLSKGSNSCPACRTEAVETSHSVPTASVVPEEAV